MNAIISNGVYTASVQLPVGRKQLAGALIFGCNSRKWSPKSVFMLKPIYMENYPDMKMNSIAVALGFCGEFHFSKVFKVKNEICPSEYKKLQHSKAFPIR